MAEPDPTTLHSDCLSELSRKERRNLLLACTVGFMVSEVGLTPQRISLPGLEFSVPSPQAFTTLVFLIVLYFLLAFVIYGVSDYFACRKRQQDYLIAVDQEIEAWSPSDQEVYDELHHRVPPAKWLYSWAPTVRKWRLLFDYLLPVTSGLLEVGLLLRRLF